MVLEKVDLRPAESEPGIQVPMFDTDPLQFHYHPTWILLLSGNLKFNPKLYKPAILQIKIPLELL